MTDLRRAFELRLCKIFSEEEIADASLAGRRRIVDRLAARARVLFKQAREQPIPPWTYCVAEHKAVLRILEREMKELVEMELREAA